MAAHQDVRAGIDGKPHRDRFADRPLRRDERGFEGRLLGREIDELLLVFEAPLLALRHDAVNSLGRVRPLRMKRASPSSERLDTGANVAQARAVPGASAF